MLRADISQCCQWFVPDSHGGSVCVSVTAGQESVLYRCQNNPENPCYSYNWAALKPSFIGLIHSRVLAVNMHLASAICYGISSVCKILQNYFIHNSKNYWSNYVDNINCIQETLERERIIGTTNFCTLLTKLLTTPPKIMQAKMNPNINHTLIWTLTSAHMAKTMIYAKL